MIFPDEEFSQAAEVESLGWSKTNLSKVLNEVKELNAASFMIVTCGEIVASYGNISKQYKVHSIRKTLINSLYGIYYDRKIIRLDEALSTLDIDDKTKLSEKEKSATIQNLLQSRSGVYIESGGETEEMREERPRRASYRPGEHFYYNNWDFNVLGTIFKKKSGQEIFQSFQREVATPLGMQDFDVKQCRMKKIESSEHAVYQFRMSARDLVRYGQLFLAKGVWDNKRILSSDWIDKSTSLLVTADDASGTKSGFGFLWWGVVKERKGLKKGILAASGLGTQKIYIVPQSQTVIVFLRDTDSYDPANPEKTLLSTKKHDLFLSKILSANRFTDH